MRPALSRDDQLLARSNRARWFAVDLNAVPTERIPVAPRWTGHDDVHRRFHAQQSDSSWNRPPSAAGFPAGHAIDSTGVAAHGAFGSAEKSALHVARCDDPRVSVKIGGILANRKATRLANEIIDELRQVAGVVDPDDYFVDLCFLTYIPGDLGSEFAQGKGIKPGMVGRKQRRFIIWIEVPPVLTTRQALTGWMQIALSESAAIVRDYLPRKGRTYPWERLAAELDDVRERWVARLAPAG